MDNILSLVGLAYRAKKVYLGETCLENISRVKFLFIGNDASDNTKERYLKKCNYYNIPYTLVYNSQDISRALGKNNVKVLGINDVGFKNTIVDRLKKEGLDG